MSIQDPVATRELTDAQGRPVRVTIGRPFEDPEGYDWSCDFSIEDADVAARERAHGVDALQALMLAIEGARIRLDGRGCTWLDQEPDNIGIPRIVPMFVDFATNRQIEAMIDREIDAWGERARRPKSER